MSTVNATSGSGSSSKTANSASDALKNVDLDQFLQLMITELQNQDPLNPMDNTQMLQQISQIRQISSTDKLSSTLDAVLVGQNLATAGSLIGREVRAVTDGGQLVEGAVQSVAMASEADSSGERPLHVNIEAHSTALTKNEDVNAQVRFTAKTAGAANDKVAIAFVDNPSMVGGNETVSYNSSSSGKSLVFQIRAGQTKASDILAALKRNAAASAAFTASLPSGSSGTGLITTDDATLTSNGGPQAVRLEKVREVLPSSP